MFFYVKYLNERLVHEDFHNFQIDTIRVIYSFTEDDPEDITGLEYHGTNRGTKSVVLINYSDGDKTLPDDTISMDFLVAEVRIPRLSISILVIPMPLYKSPAAPSSRLLISADKST